MKIVIAGNYGAKNIGDEMILDGMLTMVTSVFPDSEITILSADPKQTLKSHSTNHDTKISLKAVRPFPAGIRSFFSYLFSYGKETKRVVKECDLFILGGGGLFGGLKFIANIIWGIQAFKAYSYGKKVWMYGQSIGPLNGVIAGFIVKKLFNKSTLIAVRDKFSKEELIRIGVVKEIQVIPDMAFRSRAGAVAAQRTTPESKKKLVIALRAMENLPNNFVPDIANFVNFLISEKGFTSTIVNFQQEIGSDEFLHSELLSLIADQEKVLFLHNPNLSDIEKILSESRFVLGMRLHSVIAAIKAKAPFIAVNYAPKMKNLLEDEELSDYLIEIGDLSTEKLKEIFSKVETGQVAITQKFAQICQKNLARHLEYEDRILHL